MKRVVLAFAFVGFSSCLFNMGEASTPLPEWIPAAVQVLSEVVQAPVEYSQNGLQNIFYIDTLPKGKDAAIFRVLNMYRSHVSVGGSIVLLGFEPEAAYWATPTNEAQWLSNTTMVGTYASMVDGQARFAAGPNALGPSDGCVSSSNANASFVRCRSNGSTTFESSCQWYGDELICRSSGD